MQALGLEILGWRAMPTDNIELGKSALASEPHIEQVFVGNTRSLAPDDFDRELLRLRKLACSEIEGTGLPDFYVCSLSGRTITYKGQLTPEQLPGYYSDLTDPTFESHLALVHSRFSTNTFPSWDRAQVRHAFLVTGCLRVCVLCMYVRMHVYIYIYICMYVCMYVSMHV
jgi:glutamate synthase (NADPH/NADH)